MSVVSTPEAWYMVWNASLAFVAVVVFNVVFWTAAVYFGPRIVDLGMERWIQRAPKEQ